MTIHPLDRPLTRREIQVFRLIVTGHTHREIADIMGLLPRGLHNHKRNLYKKLKISYPSNKSRMYPIHVKKLDTGLRNLGCAIQKLFRTKD